MFCYTEETAAKAWLREERAELIFCEERYLVEYEESRNYILLGRQTIMPKDGERGSLNIYQKAEAILEDAKCLISVCCGTEGMAKGRGKIVAAYSTEGGLGKTAISYLTAVQCVKNRKTAYVNLEPLFLTYGLYHQEFRHSMEQILYAIKRNTKLQELLYETLAQNEDSVYVLPEIENFGDYRELNLNPEIIEKLCAALGRMGMECIFLDLPSGVCSFTEQVLVASSHILWCFGNTEKGKRKEEAARHDPYLKKLMGKSSIIRNCCEKKEDVIGAAVGFPYSGTIKKATTVSNVLKVNEEFASGCRLLEQNIFGGGGQ